MDPNDDILEELECGICMEVYNEPKTLPCIHTFCRVCLARHIISQKIQHQRMKGFECPLCRFLVLVPRPDAAVEQWAHQMPNNTQIPRIIQTCRERINDIKKCQYHPDETVTSFCKMCNCVACSKCLSERHPSCRGDAFITVKEMASKKREDISQGAKELNREVHRVKDNEDLVKGVICGLSDAAVSLVKQINDHAQLSVDAVLQNEAELLDQLKSVSHTQLEELKRAKNPLDEAEEILRLHNEEMESLMKTSNGSNFLSNLEVMKERRQECFEVLVHLLNQIRPPSVAFIENDPKAPSFGHLLSSSDLDALSEDDVFGDSAFEETVNGRKNSFEGDVTPVPLGQSHDSSIQSASSAQSQQTTSSSKLSPLMMYLKALGSPATNAAKRKTTSKNSKSSF